MDELRADLVKNHPRVKITDFDLYDVGIFNRCEQSRDVLVSIQSWSIVHPLMKVIPVAWEHEIPARAGAVGGSQAVSGSVQRRIGK